MKNEMSELLKLLEPRQDLKVDLRGSGKSAFVYIRSSKRAAEVSIEGSGFFVEHWDEANEQSAAAAVGSESVGSVSEVMKRLNEWL